MKFFLPRSAMKFLRSGFVTFLFLVSLTVLGQIPAGYYDAAAGKTGNTLRSALQTITATGHVKLPYTSTAFDVWDAYSYTDVTNPGGNIIWDMYSDVPGGTPAYTFTLYTEQCGTSGAEGDCYSREHCLPNSCWGGLDNASNPQYTDLHHLFPCDQYVNVQKSNNMIGETTAPTYTSSNGSKTGPCSYPGYTDKVFEPIDAYKGDFARAWLYLATRYMNTMPSWTPSSGSAAMWPLIYNSSSNNWQPWVINMLIEWNTQDPVSQKEIDRNNNIYYNTPQHNRNPYIDHPEYVCLVFGTSCVTGPTITNVVTSPASPASHDSVFVSANITDDGSILNAILYWDVTPGTFGNSITMSFVSGSTYKSIDTIPRQVAGTNIYYKIVATDNELNSTTSDVFICNIPQGEPDNHPTNFICGTTTSSSIPLTWTDAIGTIIPNGYLIKASTVDFTSIVDPSDGVQETNSTLVKNTASGIQSCTFTGLTSSTTYYFKIYAFSNSGSNINYKLIGTEASTSCATVAGGGGTAVCITEGFDGAITTMPTDWTFTSIGGTYTTSGNYGTASPSLKMDGTGDQIVTVTVSNPSELKFWIKGQGTDAISALKIEGNNGSWTQIDNITSLPVTGTTKTYNSGTSPALAAGFTQFRFTYTKSVGNLSFDDVSVTCETGCTQPSTQASGLGFNTVTSNSMIVSWARGTGSNILVLARSGSAVNADPVSGVPYSDSDVFGSGDQVGTGNYVVYNGPATSVLITGLTPTTTYYFAVYEYNTTDMCYKIPGLTGSQVTGAPVPILTTSSISSITITTTSCGGNITDQGGSAVTVRGVCWNTSPVPTIANSHTTDGSGTGTFTSSITGLSGGTTYYVRAYATNSYGTAYGDEQIFTTLRAEPSNQPAAFSCGTSTTTSITLTWTDASGPVLPHAYIIKANPVGFSNIPDPVDGVAEPDGTFIKNVVYGTQTCTFTGLNSNMTYYFKIYSYTNSNNDINFKTDIAAPQINCSSEAIPSTIAYQGFESSPQDTWTYTGGNTNSSSYKYVGTYSRQLTTTNQTVIFNNISLASYSNVNLSVAFAAVSVPKNENLYLDISYDNEATWIGTGSITLVNCNQNTGTRTVAFGATSSTKPTTVSINPWTVSIPETSTQIAIRLRSTLATSGSYYIDDIKLTGVQACTYPTTYNINGGGSYCAGTGGVAVGLDGSQTGVDYQLMSGVTPMGVPVAGTGSAISFGLQTSGGNYYVIATNTSTSCSSIMNGTSTVTIDASPTLSVSITADPGTTVCPSTPVTFTANVTNGGNATYQWRKNGSDIPGATNSTYSDTPVDGDFYRCTVTSDLACVLNSPTYSQRTMIVTAPAASVSIAVSPANNACSGTNVTFTATPVNGGTPSYQWKNGGSQISGATNSTYSSTSFVNGDVITCQMTSSISCATGNPATSDPVVMTIYSLNAVSISIAAVPSGPVFEGASVTFTATPTNGGTTPAYQWNKNGSPVLGETNAAYTTTTLTNGDEISCVLTSNISCPSGSPAVSNIITMIVNPNPALSVSPSSLTSFTYIVGAGPSTAQTYSLNGSNLTGTGNITVTGSTNYEISSDGTTFASSLTYPYGSGVITGQPKTVYVRLKAGLSVSSYNGETILNAGGGATNINVTCSGSVSPAASPVITVSSTTLSGFNYVAGTGPSTAQSYMINGTALTGSGNITVSGSTNYEVSTDGSSYTSSVTYPYDAGIITGQPKTVYVRLKAGLSAGNYNSETVSNSGGGATTVNVSCSGSVTAAGSAAGTILLIENFNYSNGALLTANGWTAHSGSGTFAITVNSAAPVTYTDYPSSNGNYVNMVSGSAEDDNRAFTSQNSGSIYYALIVNISGATTTGDYLANLGATAGGSVTIFAGRLWVKRDASNNLAFGISKSTANPSYTGFTYSLNTTYLVVVKHTFVAGATNDVADLFINPILGTTEPSPTLSTSVADNATTDPAQLTSFCLRQGSSTPTLKLDGIRVAKTWGQAVGMAWGGVTSSDWNIASNWSDGVVPGASNNVYIVPQTTPAHVKNTTGSPALCKALVINNGATLTIDPGKALTTSGATTIEGGGSFIIESDATGTGSFIDGGTISGNVTVKKYLPNGQWWYLGSPLSNGTAVAFGTLSAVGSTGNRLYYWNETSHGYSTVTNTADAMPAGRGYSFKRFDTSPLTAAFTGTLNTGTVGGAANLSYTSGISQGFNLVSNPYPSAINWGSQTTPTSGLTQTNLVTTIWYRTGGNFATYNWTVGSGNNGGQQYIPAMQAFWVRTLGGTGGLQFTNATRVHNAQGFYKESSENNIFRIQVSRDSLNDEAVVAFFADASNNYDPFDSEKMFADDDYPQLFTSTDDYTVVSINGMSALTENAEKVVPLGFLTNVAGEFSFKATNLSDFDPNVSVYLEDSYLNYFQDLNASDSYSFTSGIVNNANRFKLHFGNVLTGISSSSTNSTYIYTAESSIYVSTSAENGLLELYDIPGKKLLQKNIFKGLNKITADVPGGVYVVKFISGENIIAKKIVVE